MNGYKLYCIFSNESLRRMQGILGKVTSQSGHAFLHSYWDACVRFPEDAEAYKNGKHAKKITLVVETDEECLQLYKQMEPLCGVTKVIDSGFTVFTEPTFTCVGIGPIDEDGERIKMLSGIKSLKQFP